MGAALSATGRRGGIHDAAKPPGTTTARSTSPMCSTRRIVARAVTAARPSLGLPGQHCSSRCASCAPSTDRADGCAPDPRSASRSPGQTLVYHDVTGSYRDEGLQNGRDLLLHDVRPTPGPAGASGQLRATALGGEQQRERRSAGVGVAAHPAHQGRAPGAAGRGRPVVCGRPGGRGAGPLAGRAQDDRRGRRRLCGRRPGRPRRRRGPRRRLLPDLGRAVGRHGAGCRRHRALHLGAFRGPRHRWPVAAAAVRRRRRARAALRHRGAPRARHGAHRPGGGRPHPGPQGGPDPAGGRHHRVQAARGDVGAVLVVPVVHGLPLGAVAGVRDRRRDHHRARLAAVAGVEPPPALHDAPRSPVHRPARRHPVHARRHRLDGVPVRGVAVSAPSAAGSDSGPGDLATLPLLLFPPAILLAALVLEFTPASHRAAWGLIALLAGAGSVYNLATAIMGTATNLDLSFYILLAIVCLISAPRAFSAGRMGWSRSMSPRYG